MKLADIRKNVVKTNGISNGTINNMQNYSIHAFKVEVPNEEVFTCISGNEFVDYMCNKSK